MHKHQKLFSGANSVRPLTGAADEEVASTPQSVGFWKATLKLTGTACLAIALISILTINLISSNYYSPKLAKAVSTNTTNASSPYISLSLSSATGSSDPSNGSNIAIQVPDAGGLATGSHTLTIKTNAWEGYTVTLSSNSEQTGLVNKKDNTTTIPTITTNGTLANNTWGYSLTKPSDNNSLYIGIKPKSSPDTILESTSPTGTDQATDTGKQQAIYYGVRVDNPNTMKAGDYTAQVIYTATANIPAAPTITGISPNTINTGETKQITITGTNLASAYQTFVDLNNNGKQDSGERCANPTVTDTTITCIAPASSTATTYDVYVVTQGGTTAANNYNKLTYKEPQKTFFSISTMQQMTTAICNATTTPAASAGTTDATIDKHGAHQGDSSYVPETTLTDTRDNKTYKIRKLADGNCWMVENLALGSTRAITLNQAKSDLHSSTTWTLPAFTEIGTSIDNTSTYAIDHSKISGWKNGMGYLYTWNAAVADSGVNITSGNAQDSICPKGWQLPDYNSSKSYFNLISTTYKKTKGDSIVNNPLSFTYAGRYGNFSAGEIYNFEGDGKAGFYTISTAYKSGNYFFIFQSGYVTPKASQADVRGIGQSVRCVAR